MSRKHFVLIPNGRMVLCPSQSTRQSVVQNGVLACGMLVAGHSLYGQTFYGSVMGIVTDSSGAIVPGATVTTINTATNEKHIIKG